MEDKQIVDLYWERSERAIHETEKKYGRYCHYIAYRILENREDAEEVVNRTYLKAWDTIPPHRPELLKPYMGMLARQLALDCYEKQHAGKRDGTVALAIDELNECVSAPNGDGDPAEALALREALNRFVGALPTKTGKVFILRYWYTCSIAEIAENCDMKESSVSVLLLRTRKKLKAFLIKEGFDL